MMEQEEYVYDDDKYNKLKLVTQDDFDLIHKEDNFTTKLGVSYEAGVQYVFNKYFKKGILNRKLLDSYFYFEEHSHRALERYVSIYMNSSIIGYDEKSIENFANDFKNAPTNVSDKGSMKVEEKVYVELDYHYIDKVDPTTEKNEQMIEQFFEMLKKHYDFTIDMTFGTNQSQNHELIVEVKHCLTKHTWNEFVGKTFPKVLRIYKFNERLFKNYKMTIMLIYNYEHLSNKSFEEGEFIKFNTEESDQAREIKNFQIKFQKLKEVLKYYSIDLKVFFISDIFLSYSSSSLFVAYEKEKKQREEILLQMEKKFYEEIRQRDENEKRQRDEEKRQRDEEKRQNDQRFNDMASILKKLQEENGLLKQLK